MRKRRTLLLAVLGTFLCLAACGEPVQETEKKGTERKETAGAAENADNQELSWEDGRISLTLVEGVSVDAEIIKPDHIGETVEKCRVEIGNADQMGLANVLFPDIEAGEWKVDDYGFGTVLSYKGNLKVPFSQAEQQGNARISEGLRFYTDRWLKCEANLPVLFTSKGILTFGDLSGELDFDSRSAVAEKVTGYLREKLGMETAVEEMYTLRWQTLEAQEEKNREDGGEDLKTPESQNWTWSEEDESYYLVLERYINGIPMLNDHYLRREEGLAPVGRITVGYSANGMEGLDSLENFIVTETEPVELAGPEVILDALKKKFELLIVDSVTVTQMKLIYFPYFRPDGDCDLIPVWRITCEQGGEEQHIYIEADTGNEVTE